MAPTATITPLRKTKASVDRLSTIVGDLVGEDGVGELQKSNVFYSRHIGRNHKVKDVCDSGLGDSMIRVNGDSSLNNDLILTQELPKSGLKDSMIRVTWQIRG